MRPMLPVIGLGLVIAACPPAKAECKCRARGVIATEGQTLCISTPEGPRLARCGKVSNVTSWTFLEGPCPQAALQLTPASLGSPPSLPRSVDTRR